MVGEEASCVFIMSVFLYIPVFRTLIVVLPSTTLQLTQSKRNLQKFSFFNGFFFIEMA